MKHRDKEAPMLMDFLRAIIANDSSQFNSMLARTPSLAQQSLANGATRSRSEEFFFPEIKHYLILGDTPLHAAAASHRRDVLKALLQRGANVAAINRRGATPLHYAADGAPDSPAWNPKAQSETISLLIDAGARPDTLDKSGVAPLHRAVRNRCSTAVDCLLRKGAAVNLKNESGSTPLHLAVQNTGKSGSASPEAKALQKEIIKLLLRAGANPSDRDGRGKTALESANGAGKVLFQLMAENV
jgi:ankyrin repeat protein